MGVLDHIELKLNVQAKVFEYLAYIRGQRGQINSNGIANHERGILEAAIIAYSGNENIYDEINRLAHEVNI